MVTIEKINEFKWRIPRQGKMRVDGIVFASDKLMESIREDKSLEQVANVATLPGIVGASYAMPDIHWGYGYPIGGVAAFDPNEGGVISPGGVGYDIQCLPYDSLVLSCLGYVRPIGEYRGIWEKESLKCLNKNEKFIENTSAIRFLKNPPNGKLTRLTTESWRALKATKEHPVLTSEGMKPIGEIKMGDKVAAYHFEGVPYEEPSDEAIVTEKDIVCALESLGKKDRGSAIPQTLKFLRHLNVLPLRYNSPQLPHLIRLVAFLFGDGTFYIEKKRKRPMAAFYGKAHDLEAVRSDVFAAGFRPSPVHGRHRRHSIQTAYDTVDFSHYETSFYVSSSAFGALMMVLGVPLGPKVSQSYQIPKWLWKAPLWQKRLFLAVLFGCELSSPKTLTGHGYNFYCPTLDMNKKEWLLGSGKEFLSQLSNLLKVFGVKTNKISKRREFVNKKGEVSYRLRLILSNDFESMDALYGKIGFDYHREKQAKAAQALAYLRFKKRMLDFKQQVADMARGLYQFSKASPATIYKQLEGWVPNHQFVERALKWGNVSLRMSIHAPTFEKFAAQCTQGLEGSGCVWEDVVNVDEEPYDGSVYDFTVAHPDHNFIANGFVVSNCGVRLLRTDIPKKDVIGKMQPLVEQLFHHIPVGIGKGHRGFKLSRAQLEGVALKGAGWAVEQGYGTADDLAHLESSGCLDWADPSAVPHRAYERGSPQLGSVGSGNHFVEVDFVKEIYDEEAARALGLEKDQIVIQIHSGSRGFGHQTCTEYLPVMLKAAQKYGIELVDRQLCCAPLHSDEGKKYFGAMASAANYAFANRQMITQWVREILEQFFGVSWEKLGVRPIYDVCHNIAKWEEHIVDGKKRRLCVHRKGATRAYPKGHPELPAVYREIGQPVMIPGDMGRYSFVLIGQPRSMEETFGSSCHGAGRMMSRHKAAQLCRGRNIEKELADRGIYVRGASRATVVEEVPEAYKDVANVVDVVAGAGLSKKVAMLCPLGVIKG